MPACEKPPAWRVDVYFAPPKNCADGVFFATVKYAIIGTNRKNFQKIKNFPKKHPRKSVIISEGQNLHERSDPRDHRCPPTSPQ